MARKTTIKRSEGTVGSIAEKASELSKAQEALRVMKELERQKRNALITERPKPNTIIATTNKDFYRYDHRRKD